MNESGNFENLVGGRPLIPEIGHDMLALGQTNEQRRLNILENMVIDLGHQMRASRQENNTLKDEIDSLKRASKREIDTLKDEIETLNRTLRQESNIQKREIQILKQKQPYCGITRPDSWVNYGEGVMTRVDISHLGLQNIPHVQVSLSGTGNQWNTGGPSIYSLCNQHFEVYVKYTVGSMPNGRVTAGEAKDLGWCVSYTVTSMD